MSADKNVGVPSQMQQNEPPEAWMEFPASCWTAIPKYPSDMPC